MTVSIVPHAAIKFPAITLCNINPVRQSALRKLQQISSDGHAEQEAILDGSGMNARKKRSVSNAAENPTLVKLRHDLTKRWDIHSIKHSRNSENRKKKSSVDKFTTRKQVKDSLRKPGKRVRRKRAAGNYFQCQTYSN
eukprot:GHVU01020217.1.p1 GENE.GHVU01020217.1~~GHVU01020217.1.p1  ORF type:complete len:138 (-),score=17.76 GHVU01020217.1:586-999(-)